MKVLSIYAEHIADEDVRRRFLADVKRTEECFDKLAGLMVSEHGYQVPLVSDDARIKVVVHGRPSRDDWRRLGCFAALATGEFDGEPPQEGAQEDGK